MGASVFLMAVALVGVDVGWQRLPDGGLEYIIQVEPQMLQSLRPGEDIARSFVPKHLQGVRAYRITVGTGPVPRDEIPAEPVTPAAEPPVAAAAPTPGPTRSVFDPFPIPPRDAEEKPPRASEPMTPAPLPGEPLSREPFPRGPLAPGPTEPPAAIETPTAEPAEETSPSEVSPPALLPERQAVYLEGQPSDKPSEASPEPAGEGDDGDPSKPWLPFTLALAGFFGSLGGMLYFGWIAWDYRARYRGLLHRVLENGQHGKMPEEPPQS